MTAKRTARPDLAVRVPSRTEFLDLLRDVTRRMAEVGGFDPARVEELAVAVGDASRQAIEQAYGGASDRVVELDYFDDGAAVRIDVVDDGAKMDRAASPDGESPHGDGRRKAEGPLLSASSLDSVTYLRVARRNICRIVKSK